MTEAEATRLTDEYGLEPRAPNSAYAAWCFWLLGYPDQALWLGDEVLGIGERVQRGFSRSRGLYWNSAFHAYRGEWSIVKESSGGDRLGAGAWARHGRGG
jgi:hypothetical protein